MKLFLGIIALLALSSTAIAQQSTAISPSPRALEISRQLTGVLGSEAQMTAMVRAAQREATQSMLAARGVKPEQIDEFLTAINPPGRLEALVQKMREMQIALYAKIYTAEELEGILAFYQSPSGKAMLAKMPAVISEVTVATTALMMEYQTSIARDIAAKLQEDRRFSKPAA